MSEAWKSFCKTLDRESWERAHKLQKDLVKLGDQPQELIVNTSKYFKKGFEFKAMARYGVFAELFDKLQNAEAALNFNKSSRTFYEDFIAVAKQTMKELKQNIHWRSPIDE